MLKNQLLQQLTQCCKGILILVAFVLLSSEAYSVVSRSDEEMFILEVHLGKFLLSDGTLSYGNNGSVILPLSDVVEFLEFPITVNAQEGFADGWFISENRIFSLDVNKKEIVVAGKKLEYIEKYIELHDDDIFVDIRLLSKWFPIDFEFSLSGQSLELKSREKLPLEIAYEREQNRTKGGGANRGRKAFPRKDVPYKIFNTPYIDININTNYDSSTALSNTNIDSSFTADLFGLNSRFFLSTTDLTEVKKAQLIMGRKDPEGNLLGMLHATEFSLGDVFTEQLPLVSNSGRGRGFAISTFPLQRVTEFDRITLRGDIQPNWEIEAYRNDILLNFQKAGDNGRYEFTNIPLLTGLNVIKLIFYGPFGEKREEIRRYLIGSDLITSGKSYYSISAVQNVKDLLPINNTSEQKTYGKKKISFEYEYGLNARTSLFSYLNSTPLEDGKQHNYITAGASSSIRSVFGKYAMSHDLTNGGNAFLVDLQTRTKDFSVIVKHEQYIDFLSEAMGTNVTDPLNRRSVVTLDGKLHLLSHNLGLSLSAQQDKFKSGRTDNQVSNRLSTYIQNTNLSNNFIYRQIDSKQSSTTTLRGDLLASTTFNKFSIRGGANYSISPQANLNTLTLSGDYRIDNNSGLRTNITHSLTSQQPTEISLSMNEKYKKFNLAVNSTLNENSEFNIGLSISFAIGQNPKSKKWSRFPAQVANKGILSSRIFIDNDGNAIFSSGDTPLENIGVKINGGSTNNLTDKDGILLSAELQPDILTSIQIDTETLEDPYFVSLNEGVDIIPRSGVPVEIDFPLVPTGEIDGVVYRAKHNTTKEVSNVILELVDMSGNIVKTTKSAYDGFYLFELVPLGEYTLRISPKQIKRLKLPNIVEKKAIIKRDSPIISNQDFIIGAVAR